ncbi:sugar phosphate isomerase [Streptomyces sp. AJS327]|uniref:EboA domain-containing protein n=1 Tax=Streptomyces sp. AJS327 TaxID=2545265 RepID=UPI0015DF5CF3|nr:EboA domain-containing protein [Streptomyces sp. AJS327]MBA0052227.1 sugar phosphate isomerase [Streptomyces sp. AJS327]
MMSQLASLRTALEMRLDAAARAWLHRALDDAADAASATRRPADPPGGQPPRWERHFAEAGRRCRTTHRTGPADTAERTDPREAARVLLLHAAAADAPTLTRLYEHGTADERRAVLRALPHLVTGPDALPLVEDALRTHDTRLLAAAVGPYAAAHLDPHAWRHAVLKCLFTGVPLSAVAHLGRRAHGDTELARMLTAYADERRAADRPVPADLHRALESARGNGPRPQEP